MLKAMQVFIQGNDKTLELFIRLDRFLVIYNHRMISSTTDEYKTFHQHCWPIFRTILQKKIKYGLDLNVDNVHEVMDFELNKQPNIIVKNKMKALAAYRIVSEEKRKKLETKLVNQAKESIKNLGDFGDPQIDFKFI